jgi:CBS-domain-containing membrane protein
MNNIQVREVYRLHGQASMIIPEDAAIDYVVALLGHERHLQGLFMVDSDQRYTGTVSRFDLLKWTQLQLYGGKRRKEVPISELLRLVKAKKAKDIERPHSRSYSVKENDTLQTALDLMIKSDEDIIPVVDNAGRIIGDLCLSELLAKALEVGIQSQQ